RFGGGTSLSGAAHEALGGREGRTHRRRVDERPAGSLQGFPQQAARIGSIFPSVRIIPSLSEAASACRSRDRLMGDCRMPQPRLPRWIALAVLTGAIPLSSGCIATGPWEYIHNGFKVGPNYCRPPAPVAEEWIQAKDPKVQNRHLQDWWMVFQD